MEERQKDLADLDERIQKFETVVGSLLQNLQWNKKKLLELNNTNLVTCQYNSNHRIAPDKLETHENKCKLRSLGYNDDDLFLPEPLDPNSKTVVKLNKQDVADIMNEDAESQRLFEKGQGPDGDTEPMTLERLQCTYSTDERRVIYDAVVKAAPVCHDLSYVALPSTGGDGKSKQYKNRMEIFAQLRNLKRRRTKYRVGTKTKNYSDALRDVIKTQMEMWSEVCENKIEESKNDDQNKQNGTTSNNAPSHQTNNSNRNKNNNNRRNSRQNKTTRRDEDRQEKESEDNRRHDSRYKRNDKDGPRSKRFDTRDSRNYFNDKKDRSRDGRDCSRNSKHDFRDHSRDRRGDSGDSRDDFRNRRSDSRDSRDDSRYGTYESRYRRNYSRDRRDHSRERRYYSRGRSNDSRDTRNDSRHRRNDSRYRRDESRNRNDSIDRKDDIKIEIKKEEPIDGFDDVREIKRNKLHTKSDVNKDQNKYKRYYDFELNTDNIKREKVE